MKHPLKRRSFFKRTGLLASGFALMPLGADAYFTELTGNNRDSFLNVLDAGAKGRILI
jgi:hypothetical protein